MTRCNSLINPVTGLYSACHMEWRIDEELVRTLGSSVRFSLLHLVPNPPQRRSETLKEIASVMRLALRTADILGHGHDDQFLALLPATSLQNAVVAAQRLQKAVEEWSAETLLAVSLGFRTVEAGRGMTRKHLLHQLAGA